MEDIGDFIDNVSEKFGYSETLKSDLKRIVPIMLAGKDEKKRQLLFDTLREVKIFVLPENASVADLEKCKTEVFGQDNADVTFTEADMGEYSKTDFAAGAYISEPVFDDNMNIVGRNRMLYVQELSKYSQLNQVYGSNINLSHLIHELGHAWAAEKDEYVQQPDGSFVQNVGACSIASRVDRDTKSVVAESTDGLFIEETLNTIQEENTLFSLTGIRNVSELTAKGYVRSSYQGMQTDVMRAYVEKFGEQPFEAYRYEKDMTCISDVEKALVDTKAWQALRSKEYVDKKRASLASVERLQTSTGEVATWPIKRIKELFEKYPEVYFPDNEQFTPIQKVNNVLEQLYDLGTIKYNFNIMDNPKNLEIYKEVVTAIVSEANALRIQAPEIVADKGNDFVSSLQAKKQPSQAVSEYYLNESKRQQEQCKEIE